ncbi:MAG: Bug family tripartite tricarboxylate transporter substrate binding protein [Burkholderiales bacterium]
MRITNVTPHAAKLAVTLLLAAACALPEQSRAQPWPTRTIRIVAPFAPGGTADTLGRLVAQRLTETLKQSVIVENRSGAGGFIGSDLVAKAAPDGYTLVISGIASHVLAPAVAKAPFDPMRDFTHIALLGGPPTALIVNPNVPAKNLAEFIALARAKPGELSYGSPGNGTHGHLVAELLKLTTRIDMTHVPYKGASMALADVIASHISAGAFTLTTSSAQIRAGKVRALASTADKRLLDYPDLPTFAELGYPALTAITWFSLSGPAGLPADIVIQLNAEVRRALVHPEVREKTKIEGIEPNNLDAPQFVEFVRAEIARWTPVIKAANVKGG